MHKLVVISLLVLATLTSLSLGWMSFSMHGTDASTITGALCDHGHCVATNTHTMAHGTCWLHCLTTSPLNNTIPTATIIQVALLFIFTFFLARAFARDFTLPFFRSDGSIQKHFFHLQHATVVIRG